MRAHFLRIAELIQSHGLDRVREPYVKHLEGALWEMRLKGRSSRVPGAPHLALRDVGSQDARLASAALKAEGLSRIFALPKMLCFLQCR